MPQDSGEVNPFQNRENFYKNISKSIGKKRYEIITLCILRAHHASERAKKEVAIIFRKNIDNFLLEYVH